MTALTLSVRVIGGSVGYCIFYNVFATKLKPQLIHYIGGTLLQAGITSTEFITTAIELTAASMVDELALLPGVQGNPLLYETLVVAGRIAYAEAYKWVYYVSIAFGGVSILAALFLGDVRPWMDERVAVVM